MLFVQQPDEVCTVGSGEVTIAACPVPINCGRTDALTWCPMISLPVTPLGRLVTEVPATQDRVQTKVSDHRLARILP
jgi:hypothetical protein